MRFVVVLALVASCAQDYQVRYPAPPDEPTSSIVLLLSEAADGVSVAVNGNLVLQDAKTRRVIVDHVPIGTAEVVMTANGGDKSFKIWVGGDKPTTVPLGAPAPGTGLLGSILGAVITVVVYALIHQ